MEHLFAIKYSWLIPLLPLLGAAIAGFLCTGKRKALAHWPIWISVGISAILSISLLLGMLGEHEAPKAGLYYVQDWYHWISAGGFDATVGFLFDPLTAVMLCVVTGIGFLITVFAAGYMKGEEGYSRFFAYLGLFIFMMTMLVMGNNFLMLYLGWEGVGLCSYLLIGYYYEKPSAREAAKKAFLVNRVGDFGFGLGVMLMFLAFGTISYFGGSGAAPGVLQMAAMGQFTSLQSQAMQWLPFLLMLGAFGKSAQFPLYVWLPDAMEGPTPVSALIHAATMVTAGVYMIVRCGTLFVGNDAAMLTITIIGAFTAIFAASIAMRQFDLKKVFAYSTISQLGFMFVGVGVLAPVAGVFHLVTHAFFKALLFLSSGVVMHAMLGELDMRKMSGLKHVLPKTRWLIICGSLALAGFPFVSGFFSKDEIVAAAWHRYPVIAVVLLIVAFMTAYYTFRLYFRVFEGPLVLPPGVSAGHEPSAPPTAGDDSHSAPHTDSHAAPAGHGSGHGHAGHHNHEPSLMIMPLIVLAIGALFAGYLNTGERLGEFLGKSPSLIASFDIAREHAALAGETLAPAPFGQEEYRQLTRQEHGAEKNAHFAMMVVSGLISAAAIYLAYLLHRQRRDIADALLVRVRRIARVLDAKYWVDEVYQTCIVEPLRKLGRLFFAFDQVVVDGLVWLAGFVPQGAGFAVKVTTQRGYLQGYASAMVLGVLIILLIVVL